MSLQKKIKTITTHDLPRIIQLLLITFFSINSITYAKTSKALCDPSEIIKLMVQKGIMTENNCFYIDNDTLRLNVTGELFESGRHNIELEGYDQFCEKELNDNYVTRKTEKEENKSEFANFVLFLNKLESERKVISQNIDKEIQKTHKVRSDESTEHRKKLENLKSKVSNDQIKIIAKGYADGQRYASDDLDAYIFRDFKKGIWYNRDSQFINFFKNEELLKNAMCRGGTPESLSLVRNYKLAHLRALGLFQQVKNSSTYSNIQEEVSGEASPVLEKTRRKCALRRGAHIEVEVPGLSLMSFEMKDSSAGVSPSLSSISERNQTIMNKYAMRTLLIDFDKYIRKQISTLNESDYNTSGRNQLYASDKLRKIFRVMGIHARYESKNGFSLTEKVYFSPPEFFLNQDRIKELNSSSTFSIPEKDQTFSSFFTRDLRSYIKSYNRVQLSFDRGSHSPEAFASIKQDIIDTVNDFLDEYTTKLALKYPGDKKDQLDEIKKWTRQFIYNLLLGSKAPKFSFDTKVTNLEEQRALYVKKIKELASQENILFIPSIEEFASLNLLDSLKGLNINGQIGAHSNFAFIKHIFPSKLQLANYFTLGLQSFVREARNISQDKRDKYLEALKNESLIKEIYNFNLQMIPALIIDDTRVTYSLTQDTSDQFTKNYKLYLKNILPKSLHDEYQYIDLGHQKRNHINQGRVINFKPDHFSRIFNQDSNIDYAKLYNFGAGKAGAILSSSEIRVDHLDRLRSYYIENELLRLSAWGGATSTIYSLLDYRDAYLAILKSDNFINSSKKNILSEKILFSPPNSIHQQVKELTHPNSKVYFSPAEITQGDTYKKGDKSFNVHGFFHPACNSGTVFLMEEENLEFKYLSRLNPKKTGSSTSGLNTYTQKSGEYDFTFDLLKESKSKDRHFNMSYLKRPKSYFINAPCDKLDQITSGDELVELLNKSQLLDWTVDYKWEQVSPKKSIPMKSYTNIGQGCLFSPLIPQSHDVGGGGSPAKQSESFQSIDEIVGCPMIDILKKMENTKKDEKDLDDNEIKKVINICHQGINKKFPMSEKECLK